MVCGGSLPDRAAIWSFITYLAAKRERRILREQVGPRTAEEDRLKRLRDQHRSLQVTYGSSRIEFTKASQKLSLFELGVGSIDVRPYENRTKTDSPDEIEASLSKVREQFKAMVKAKTACICKQDWSVNNRRAEGRKLINREIKLRLRCFDNACRFSLSLVEWNNINRLKERIKGAFDEINSSGSSLGVYLQPTYLNLRLSELELDFELGELKSSIKEREREERQIAREAEREEARIKMAAEAAISEREYCEDLVAQELAKLRLLSGENHSAMQKQIEAHQAELTRLQETEKRAISMAQQTRAGYVYVVSNWKSFGEGICKIGMTRRVDPNDRVKELGNASVPELFDVHAFMYSEDAPALEKFLHARFSKQRVNLMNSRKEFFFVTPDQVLKEVSEYPGEVSLQLPETGSPSEQ